MRQSAAQHEADVAHYAALESRLAEQLIQEAKASMTNPIAPQTTADPLGPLESDPIRNPPYNGPQEWRRFLASHGDQVIRPEYIFFLGSKEDDQDTDTTARLPK